MTTIIQEIAQTISKNFEEELQKLMTQDKDISEFILETKKMMDQIGVKLVKESKERSRDSELFKRMVGKFMIFLWNKRKSRN